VLQLPLGAVLLASSATAVNELWCFGPNVLASQFHLELTAPLVLQKILGALKDNSVLTEQQAEDSRRVLEAGDSNTALFLQVSGFHHVSIQRQLLRACLHHVFHNMVPAGTAQLSITHLMCVFEVCDHAGVYVFMLHCFLLRVRSLVLELQHNIAAVGSGVLAVQPVFITV